MMMLIVVMLVSAMRREYVEGTVCSVWWCGDRVMSACVRGRFTLCDGMVMWCGSGAAWAWVAVELEALRALWRPPLTTSRPTQATRIVPCALSVCASSHPRVPAPSAGLLAKSTALFTMRIAGAVITTADDEVVFSSDGAPRHACFVCGYQVSATMVECLAECYCTVGDIDGVRDVLAAAVANDIMVSGHPLLLSAVGMLRS